MLNEWAWTRKTKQSLTKAMRTITGRHVLLVQKRVHVSPVFLDFSMSWPGRAVQLQWTQTDLLSAGLQQVAQMFDQLCECWPICGTVQPAVQHGLVSMNKGGLNYKRCKSRCCDMLRYNTLTFPLHFRRGVFWRSHPRPLFQPPAERFIDANAWIRRSPCGQKKGWCRRSEVVICLMVGVLWLLGLPREKISQRSTPKDQTSLCVV